MLLFVAVKVLSCDAEVFSGDLKGVLKGERKGLESVGKRNRFFDVWQLE